MGAGLRGASDPEIFRWAAEAGRRVVTENIKDSRPLLVAAIVANVRAASLLLVHPRRFPRGSGDRAATIVAALDAWLRAARGRPPEDWLVPERSLSNPPAPELVEGPA